MGTAQKLGTRVTARMASVKKRCHWKNNHKINQDMTQFKMGSRTWALSKVVTCYFSLVGEQCQVRCVLLVSRHCWFIPHGDHPLKTEFEPPAKREQMSAMFRVLTFTAGFLGDLGLSWNRVPKIPEDFQCSHEKSHNFWAYPILNHATDILLVMLLYLPILCPILYPLVSSGHFTQF